MAAREQQAMADLERGGAAPDLVPQLLALVSEHPFRERPHALLMRALAVAGRQAEALDVYATVRARLADELGIEPGAELRAAQIAVLRQEAATAEPAAPTGVVLAVSSMQKSGLCVVIPGRGGALVAGGGRGRGPVRCCRRASVWCG